MQLIPAIDLRQGRCVRLYQGDYQRETHYDTDPVVLARHYAEAGSECLHLVDLDGAREGAFTNLAVIERIVKEVDIPVQCGGGIRALEQIQRLFDAGVYRAVIGSLAVRQPDLVTTWLERWDSDRICLALDVRADQGGVYRPAVSGWTQAAEISLEQVLDGYKGQSLRHVLCTDIARDGTLEGPNVALYQKLSSAYPDIHLQASGGVSDCASIGSLRGLNLAGVIVGRALLEGRISIQQALASVA